MRPTRRQTAKVQEVLEWYFARCYLRPHDLGTPAMYCDRALVGAFAVSDQAFARGDPAALFKVLVATTVFQRLKDQLALRILAQMPPQEVAELANVCRLRQLIASSTCPHVQTLTALVEVCDLTKDRDSRGTCTVAPGSACFLKRHTTILKRYGHFGKVPASLALVLHAEGARDLSTMRTAVLRASDEPAERSRELQRVLMRAWRVSEKISAMFLSAVANPDLSLIPAPWSEGIDWTQFVCVDINTDRFLEAVGYDGAAAYGSRAAFVSAIAEQVDLSRFRRTVHSYNPRLVQQAMYAFMGTANRRANREDCMHQRGACTRCPAALRSLCPVRE